MNKTATKKKSQLKNIFVLKNNIRAKKNTTEKEYENHKIIHTFHVAVREDNFGGADLVAYDCGGCAVRGE